MKMLCKSANLFLSLLLLSFPAALSAGELEPSAPPSSGTMKTLDEVEPRIPIPGSETPVDTFDIYESGSYYLTGNRVCSSTGIYISSGVNNVTIDLCGYTLSAEEGSTGSGIKMQSCRNVSISNGTVTGFSARGIVEHNSDSNAGGHRISNVHISNTGSGHYSCNAITLYGKGHTVENCIIRDNSNDGIVLSGGGTVRNNICTGNGGKGIFTYGNDLIKGNRCCDNGEDGIRVNNGNSILIDNVCTGNEEHGITTSSADACRIEGNVFSSNERNGIHAGQGSVIKSNTARNNGMAGIQSGDNSLIIDNTAFENATYGIFCQNGYIDSNCAVGNNNNIYSLGSTVGTNHAP
ncbi:right-handed parallel beta-helix repeat-containing protein [Sedimentisphaera salicampi]|uniref:right-handed parallel beta-helix repeat-containing protein n=1 Tax=Sedimentisphaera salicampi TaxID=1941349 RepID=UPI000B9A4DF9|nr:right-handed parallel beta-helix repeat-containing protein [Sedimentisphaera salicampi]OXU14243.1 hypothetical protein SMSP1_02009 [Sedimentisphaera salicampi]